MITTDSPAHRSTIERLLGAKQRSVITILATATASQAAETLTRHNIGALVITDGDRVTGIISERDIVRAVVATGRDPQTVAVGDLMTTDPVCLQLHDDVRRGMLLMTDKRIRHLPVLDDQGALVGIVSIGDLVKAVIEDQRFLIDQLEHYIMGIDRQGK